MRFCHCAVFSSKRSKSSRWAARAFRSSVKPEALKRTYQTVRWSRSQGTASVLATKSQKTRGPTGSCIIPQIIIISSITLQRERKLLILLPNALILQKGCKCAGKSAMLGATRGIARLALPISCGSGKRQPTTKRGI